MKKGKIEIRTITLSNIDDIIEIQKKSYLKQFIEDEETFKNMVSEFPEGNKIILVGGLPAGYIFSHPFFENKLQELKNNSFELSGKEDCMYIHDISMKPEFRGMGLSKILIESVIKIALKHNFRKLTLVAVQKSESFWQKHGFRILKEVVYGGSKSYYMIKRMR